MAEQERIIGAYRRRQDNGELFIYQNQAHIFRLHERFQVCLKMLANAGYHPLTNLKILDVGCGDGNMLRQFLQWGAQPANLAGIDLRSETIEYAQSINPNLDFRCGSATELPWKDGGFDLVCQHTVFTSILDGDMKAQVAAEMRRVISANGAILWYDFMYDNPRNPDVGGVKLSEIRALFPGFRYNLRRITLAPPIARRIPERFLPVLYPLLASIPWLRTHYLGLLKPEKK